MAARLMTQRGAIATERADLLTGFNLQLDRMSDHARIARGVVASYKAILDQVNKGLESIRTEGAATLYGTRGYPLPGVSHPREDVPVDDLTAAVQALTAFADAMDLGAERFTRALWRGTPPPPRAAPWLFDRNDPVDVPARADDFWHEVRSQREYAKMFWWQEHEMNRPLAANMVRFRSQLVPRSVIALLVLLGVFLVVGGADTDGGVDRTGRRIKIMALDRVRRVLARRGRRTDLGSGPNSTRGRAMASWLLSAPADWSP